MLSVMREQMHCCVVSIDVVVVSVVRLLMSGDLARLADTMPNLDELCLHLAWRRNLLKISAQVSEDEDGPPEEVLRLKISLVQASLNRIIALCRSPPASAPSKHKTKMQMRRPASTTASCRSCLDSGVNADSFSAQMLNEAVEAHARAPKEDSSVSLPDLCVCGSFSERAGCWRNCEKSSKEEKTRKPACFYIQLRHTRNSCPNASMRPEVTSAKEQSMSGKNLLTRPLEGFRCRCLARSPAYLASSQELLQALKMEQQEKRKSNARATQ